MKSKELSLQTSDYVASAAKAALGAIPFAGSLLTEIAGYVIPNQRIDRIVKYAEVLEKKLATVEQEFVRAKLTDENFTDLMEEGLRQAAHSLTDERRLYIATLITKSLSSEDIQFVEARHLLRLLGEINDIEMIWLRFYLITTIYEGDEEFRTKHSTILEPVHAGLDDAQEIHEKAALQRSYNDHLTQLGLLEQKYRTDIETRIPEFDKFTGAMKVIGYGLTSEGRLLLKYVGFTENNIQS